MTDWTICKPSEKLLKVKLKEVKHLEDELLENKKLGFFFILKKDIVERFITKEKLPKIPSSAFLQDYVGQYKDVPEKITDSFLPLKKAEQFAKKRVRTIFSIKSGDLKRFYGLRLAFDNFDLGFEFEVHPKEKELHIISLQSQVTKDAQKLKAQLKKINAWIVDHNKELAAACKKQHQQHEKEVEQVENKVKELGF